MRGPREESAPAALIVRLERMVEEDDVGALAALRRGLGKPPGAVPITHRYVVPFIRRDAHRSEEDAHYLVASLFAAWYQGRKKLVPSMASYGEAMRSLMHERESGSVEKRFEAILGSDRERVHEMLRHGISLLSSQDIPLNWDLRNRSVV